MKITPLPFRAPLVAYERQADDLLRGWNQHDRDAVEIVRRKHPRFLDETIKWLPKNLSDEDLRRATLDGADARLALARWYDFADWPRLAEYVDAVTQDDSPVCRFESAVEAVISGDLAGLGSLLRHDPDLVRERSTRVTHFDPPQHRATLLHYIAANGVEGHRQVTPPNAVDIARALLRGGAEPDALAQMYGGDCTTMSMLVSSGHPAKAGVQAALVDVLVDYGAAVESRGNGDWTSPLLTALAFGYREAADTLVRRGATVRTVAAAAGLGRTEEVRALLPAAAAIDRHRALALAAQHGHVDVVRLLLDAGEDPNRYNPKGNHGHSTPLHQAALAGHADVVRLLVERGARLDITDTIYHGRPVGWARYAGRSEIAEYLQAQESRA
jgi:ankyrin repeat protein